MIQQQNQSEQHYFFLFVNSRSGGCKGKQYLSIPNGKLKLKSKHGFYVYVFIYDLFNSEQSQLGFKNVKRFSQISQNINIIACGGDGTILWVVNCAMQAGIDPEKVYFGVIPIGTGNDFSRSLGWGGSPISFKQGNLRQLRKLIQKWVNASKQYFDLWDVTIKTTQEGNILSSSSNIARSSQNTTFLQKTFSNYVGIGIDARVSYHFEKNRTSFKLLNLALYGCIGFLCCLRKTQKMHKSLLQFSESDSQSQPDSNKIPHQLVPDSSKSTITQQKDNVNNLVTLKKGYCGIVCLNCTSYMSGVMNIFNTQKIASKNKKHQDFGQQSYNDGKIQFIGFKNQLSLGLQRFIKTAGRISQGQGPYNIKFDTKKESKQTYVQIDGQAVVITGLSQIKISQSKLTKSGKIRVLVNNK